MANEKAIGGYYELDISRNSFGYPHQNAFKFQSARAAFRALLRLKRPSKVWMPKYICNAMLLPLQEEQIDVQWYSLDERLNIDPDVVVGSGELILYVDYFGICGDNVNVTLSRFPQGQVILDCSQSFYAEPNKRALATIYSPRKFFGVPDGGLLATKLPIETPVDQEKLSQTRMTHLIKRLYESPESGYADYQRAETSLDDCIPRRMSGLTERILLSIDYEACKQKRSENYLYLHSKLKHLNLFQLAECSDAGGSLCYPFFTKNLSLRQSLIQSRVFIPIYWSDAIERMSESETLHMVHRLLPLPIDHRYGFSDMDRIVKLIVENVS